MGGGATARPLAGRKLEQAWTASQYCDDSDAGGAGQRRLRVRRLRVRCGPVRFTRRRGVGGHPEVPTVGGINDPTPARNLAGPQTKDGSHDDNHRGAGCRPATQGEAPRDVGARQLSRTGNRSHLRTRAGAGEREQGPARRSGAGCRGRLGQRGHSGGIDRRHGRCLRPDARIVRRRTLPGRRARRDADLGNRGRGGDGIPRRRFRHRDVVCRGDVRTASPAGRRRVDQGLPDRRDDRAAELDTGRLRRATVRDDEAVRTAAAARCAAAAVVGQRGSRPGTVR